MPWLRSPPPLVRTVAADPFRTPEVADVERELSYRGYELRQVNGRYSAWRAGRIHFASDDVARLLDLTRPIAP